MSLMDRLLIFGDNSLLFPQIFIQKINSLIKEREDIIICGVVDTTKYNPPSKTTRILTVILPALVKKFFNFELKLDFNKYRFNNLSDICSKLNINVIVPPKRDINDQEFIDFLEKSIRPTMGLSIGCLQIFQKDLINLFEILVNYHNGLLPAYAGRRATLWSIYFAEKYTGFTFHLVTRTIDGGNILLQNKIPIYDRDVTSDVDYLKAIEAANYIGDVLDKMTARDKGIPQEGKSTYFGTKEFESITTIREPHELTFEETKKRLSAFKCLKIKIQGIYYPITKIREHTSISISSSALIFITKDYVPVKALRFLYMPFFFYKIYDFIKRL